jgi:hypothetical protein
MIPLEYRLAAGLIALASAWAWGHHVASASAELEITALKGSYAAAAASASESARRTEQQNAAMTQEVSHVAQLSRDHAAADARLAVESHISLLDAARAGSHPPADDSCPPDTSQTRPAPVNLCPDVLSRVDSIAGELAAALDQANAAGRACEQWADALKRE